MNVITKTVQLPDGRTITIETGKLAKQADGSVVLRMNNTVLLATVCAAKDAVPGTDFMPLQVDYREQYSAAGRFPGGFTKREGKPGDNEILTSRLVDRVLRPLFPSNYHAEVFVNVMLLSADGVDQPDALAGFAASAALACSDIPFECPISEVRVARVNGEYVIDPTYDQMKHADMDIMVGASADNIMMVEGEMKEVSEQDLLGALKAAMDAIKPMCELQAELSKELGTDVKREYDHEVNDEELRERMNKELYQPAYDITKQALPKQERADAFEKLLEDFKEKFFAERAAQSTTPTEPTTPTISDDEYAQGWRLSCVSRLVSDVTVEVPDIASAYRSRMKVADISSPKELEIFNHTKAEIEAAGIEFGNNLSAVTVTMDAPTTARDRYYDAVFAQVGKTLQGANFWGWSGLAVPRSPQWERGDPYTGDPAQEAQGLNGVYAGDSTVQIINHHTNQISNQSNQ